VPYCTQVDLIERFGEAEITQLSDRAGLGTLDSAVVGGAIDDADAEIDGYLSGRYALPLASVPTVMVRLACDISRYYLFGHDVTDLVRERYEQAIGYLVKIATGVIGLGPEDPGPESGTSSIQSDARTFAVGMELL
jgi:phage gp36-like protein